MRANDIRAFGFLVEKLVHLRHRSIKCDHSKAVVVHVQNQILAHNGQANHRDIAFGFHKFTSKWVKPASPQPYRFTLSEPEQSRRVTSAEIRVSDKWRRSV